MIAGQNTVQAKVGGLESCRINMNLPPQSNLTDKKYAEIVGLLETLDIHLEDIEEKFVRGSGHGGQKINKTSNAVQLKHLPTGITVKYQKYRERSMNRILALRELLEKMNPSSKASQKIEKMKKKKKRRKRRQTNITAELNLTQ